MAVLVRCCCCGCNLKNGIQLIALLSLISGGYGIYSNFRNASLLKSVREVVREDPKLQSSLPVPFKYFDSKGNRVGWSSSNKQRATSKDSVLQRVQTAPPESWPITHYDPLQAKNPIAWFTSTVVLNLLKTSGVFSIIVLLTTFLLIGAYNSKNRFLVLPYLAWHVILLGYNLGVSIFFIIVWKGFGVYSIVIAIAISWVFSIYFLVVVYSFHEALREDPSGATAGYSPANAPGQAASGPPAAAVQMYNMYKPDV